MENERLSNKDNNNKNIPESKNDENSKPKNIKNGK